MTGRLVLVTGGLGYVGSALVPKLAEIYPVRVFDSMMFGNSLEGTPNVEFVQGDIRDVTDVVAAVNGCTDVIHLAAVVTDELVDLNVKKGHDINVKGTKWVADAAGMVGTRLIYASSSSVYGSQDVVCNEDTEPHPQTEYAQQKLEAERYVLGTSLADGIVTTAVRSATLAGLAPRMRLDTILNIFSAQAYFKREVTVWDGTQWRSNIHVDDIVRLYIQLLDAPAELINGEVFNASYDYNTAAWLGGMVADLVGVPLKVDAEKRDPRQYRMSADKACRVLEFHPEKSLVQAVHDNLAFFKAGGITDPDDAIYRNTARMADFMRS